jgi:hypothetical protein
MVAGDRFRKLDGQDKLKLVSQGAPTRSNY